MTGTNDRRPTRTAGRRLGGSGLGHSLWTSVLLQGVLVVSGALAARALGVDDRGTLALLVLFPSVLALVGSLGLPYAATYALATAPGCDRALWRQLRRPTLLQCSVLVVVQALLVLVLAPALWRDYPAATVMSLIATPAALAQDYGLAFLQGWHRYRAILILRVLQPGLYAALVVVIFVAGMHSVFAFTAAWSLTNVAAAVITLGIMLRTFPRAAPSGTPPSMRQLTRFGLVGLPGMIPFEAFRLDQAAIGLFLTTGDLGLYVVALSLTNLPRFVARGLAAITYPKVAACPDVPSRNRTTLEQLARATLACGTIVILLEVLSEPLLLILFGQEFSGALQITRILLIGAMLQSLRIVLAEAARGHGRPELSTISELTSWVTLIPALFILMPPLGLDGVAWAIVVSSALSLGALAILLALRASTPSRRWYPEEPVAEPGAILGA